VQIVHTLYVNTKLQEHLVAVDLTD